MTRTFSELIRQRRLEAGLTQVELANLTGLTAKSIISYERGSVPGVGCLKALAKALDMPLADLMDAEFPVDHRTRAGVY